MDFETLGAISGMQNDLASLRRVAQAEIDRLARVARERNAEIADLQAQVAQLQAALAVETAHRVGLLAQGRTLRAELSKVSPNHVLFTKTGKVYSNGQAHIALNVVFENAFDDQAKKLGIKEPKKARADAK